MFHLPMSMRLAFSAALFVAIPGNAKPAGGGLDEANSLVTPPAQFKGATGNGKPAAGVARMPLNGGEAWWRIFHDHTLEGLEVRAVAANQDLRQAVARVTEARQESRVAAADFYPHVEAPLRATRQRTTNTGPTQRGRFTGDGSALAGPIGAICPTGGSALSSFFTQPVTSQPLTSTFDDFRAPLTVTYEVDVFGRIRAAYGQAHANAEAAEADRRAVELSLTAQVAAGYFNLRALDAQILILRRTAALREDARHLQEQRLRLGAGTEVDVTRAEVELANTQSDLTDALRERAEGENGLAALCGALASEFRIAEHPLGEQAPPKVPAGVPGTLLARRPDLLEADRRISAALSGVHVARAELLPTFDIEGDGGYESAKTSQLTEWQSRTWELLATVRVPLFEGGKNVANLAAAKARRDAAVAAYQQTAVTAFKEVENALADLKQRTRQAESRAVAATKSERVLADSQERYDQGAATYFEVVDAERDLLNAQLRQVETLAARYAATVELVRALGGGWGSP
jgi:outer membrane protein, multidrug efflux system